MSSEAAASDSEDDTQSVSSSSSEDVEPEDPMEEKEFLKTLSALKSKDPKIYDGDVHFFEELPTTNKAGGGGQKTRDGDKIVTLWEHERNILTGHQGQDEDDASQKELPYSREQQRLKDHFKKALVDSESEDDEGGGLLKKKVKTQEDQQREDEEHLEWLKGSKKELDDKEVEGDLRPLKDFWSRRELDDGEAYLRDYILNRLYEKEENKSLKVDDAELSEDGDLLEEQAKYETRYNFRFEENSNSEVKRYPRQIEGSLRKKDDSRKRKRAELRQRKREEKAKKQQEVTAKQKEKLTEIKERLEKLKKATGNDQLAFPEDELLGDFDPEAHDKAMAEAYGDRFYAEDDQPGEKPTFSDLEDGSWDPENIDMDCDAPSTSKPKESRSKKKRKKKALERGFSDLMTELGDGKRPEFDPTKYDSFTKYLDEVYSLDCEDFIQDLPCKFKYRQVVPNDYGLTVEEILAADDSELNQWASAKKITKLRPEHVEKNEVKIYRKKAQDLNLKAKILSSVYKAEEQDTEANMRDEEEEKEEGEKPKLEKTLNRVNKKRSDAKNHKRFKKDFPSSSTNEDSISDSRLLAYAINPKQFKRKMKFKNSTNKRSK